MRLRFISRNFCIPWVIAACILPQVAFAQTTHPAAHPAAESSEHAPLAALLDGNKRFAEQHLVHPDQTMNRVHRLARDQHPFAAVLGCADSRVPPEVIFDQGIGDLFVVREAGNIVDDAVLASLEYAVSHLGVSLILVLGHERCGAIGAALHHDREGHLGVVVDALEEAVSKAAKAPGDQHDLAVRLNVENVTRKLRESKPILAEQVKSGHLKVVGGYYDLDTGRVHIIAP